MRDAMSAMDLHFLVREFQILVGARLDKLYQQRENKRELAITLHKAGEGKRILQCHLPRLLFLTEHKQPFPQQPPGFCLYMRRQLSQAKLVAIEQCGFDRIIRLELTTREGTRHLYLELITPGNAVLTREEKTIITPLESQAYKDRTIRPGIPYAQPPTPTDPRTLDAEQLHAILGASTMDSVVKALAADCSLGGAWAEEVCARAQVDKATPRVSEQQSAQLHRAIRQIIDAPIDARLVDGEALPIPFLTREEGEAHASFSAAIERLIMPALLAREAHAGNEASRREHDRHQKIIEQQERKLEGFEQSAIENQRKGELLYERYQQVSALLAELDALRRRAGWDAVRERAAADARISEVDEQHATITIELDEERA